MLCMWCRSLKDYTLLIANATRLTVYKDGVVISVYDGDAGAMLSFSFLKELSILTLDAILAVDDVNPPIAGVIVSV